MEIVVMSEQEFWDAVYSTTDVEAKLDLLFADNIVFTDESAEFDE